MKVPYETFDDTNIVASDVVLLQIVDCKTGEVRGRSQLWSISRQRIYYVGALTLSPSPTNETRKNN